MPKGKKDKKWHPYLDWDDEGCLYIKDDKLAQQIYDAIWMAKSAHHPLRIVRDDPEWESDDPTGGVGNPKQNMQCPC